MDELLGPVPAGGQVGDDELASAVRDAEHETRQSQSRSSSEITCEAMITVRPVPAAVAITSRMNLQPGDRIQARDRLVQGEQRGALGQRHGQRHLRLLTAGQGLDLPLQRDAERVHHADVQRLAEKPRCVLRAIRST